MKTKAQRLIEKIEAECGVFVKAPLQRVRAGHWQRSAGAWSWHSRTLPERGDNGEEVGSQFSVTELLKSKKLIHSRINGSIHIDPSE